MITYNYSLAIVATCATASIGFFIAASVRLFKKRGHTYALTASLLFSGAGLGALVVMVGNPSRLFNVLASPFTGFSIVTIGLALMALLSFTALISIKKGNVLKCIVISVGIFAAVYLFWGVALMFVKPSRTALSSWHIPLFMLGCVALVYGCGVNSRLFRAAGVIFKAVAVTAFIYHLYALEIPDKYLSIEIVTGQGAWLMFGGVIAAGTLAPLFLELIRNKTFIGAGIQLLAVLGGNLAFFILINITVTRAGNMV